MPHSRATSGFESQVVHSEKNHKPNRVRKKESRVNYSYDVPTGFEKATAITVIEMVYKLIERAIKALFDLFQMVHTIMTEIGIENNNIRYMTEVLQVISNR